MKYELYEVPEEERADNSSAYFGQKTAIRENNPFGWKKIGLPSVKELKAHIKNLIGVEKYKIEVCKSKIRELNVELKGVEKKMKSEPRVKPIQPAFSVELKGYAKWRENLSKNNIEDILKEYWEDME